MDLRLVTLKLFLDELRVPADIRTVDDRKRLQKAVYLGQLSGVDLGYRYNWYLKGPYSPTLARDYYALAEALEGGGDDASAGRGLKPAAQAKLQAMQALLSVPPGNPLPASDWYELLASQHYLLKITRYDEQQTRDTIAKQKSYLTPYFDTGIASLTSHGIL